MEVIVIEGPAGSGKSTIAEEIANTRKTIVYHPFPARQGIRDHKGPELSFLRDMTVMKQILLDREHQVLVLDRFWFSPLVYDSLRQQGFFSEDIITEHRDKLFEIINAVQDDFTIRGLSTNVYLRLKIIFNLPSVEEIESRRHTAYLFHQREYPFDAGAELALYHRIYTALRFKNLRAELPLKIREWEDGKDNN